MRHLFIYIMLCLLALPAMAQDDDTEVFEEEERDSLTESSEEHVQLLGIPLSATPQQLLDAMRHHGIHYDRLDGTSHTHWLHGTLSGMEITIEVRCNKNEDKINLVKFSTSKHLNQHEDYERMLRWLQKEYDQPDWRGTVRNHHFCRWFADFDRDIILIAAGNGSVEAWFYENHKQRNIDYYSILKYCERYPATDVPRLTAQESVTWKNDSTPVVRKHVAKRHGKKRSSLKKRKTYRRKSSAKRHSKKRTTHTKKRRR